MAERMDLSLDGPPLMKVSDKKKVKAAHASPKKVKKVTEKKSSQVKKQEGKVKGKPAAAAFVKKLLAASSAASSSAAPAPSKRAKITIGSDCSGYGSEALALRLCGIDFTCSFCAEIDPVKVQLLDVVHQHCSVEKGQLFQDIKTRDNALAPAVDLFVSGAPCPAWSSAGKRLGLEDLKDRGVTLFYSLDYVREKKPAVVLLENVKGLTFSTNKHILDSIVEILKNLGYKVWHKVANTAEHGIPHNRPRLYLVAALQSRLKREFAFPKKLPRPSLDSFIDMKVAGSESDLGKQARNIAVGRRA